MPKTDWEESEQHITLIDYIKKLEKQFFDNPYKQFMKNPSTWQWNAQEDSKAWGLQGSIFTGWEAPKEWTTCPLTSCGCGADVILSKAKDELALENLNVTKYGYCLLYTSPSPRD